MPYMIPRTQTVVLDANGAGEVDFTIDNHDQRWIIDSVTVATSQAPAQAPVPVCRWFRNGVFAGGTSSGAMDSGTGRVILYVGDTLTARWSGGISGTTATASIEGTFDPDGQPIQD